MTGITNFGVASLSHNSPAYLLRNRLIEEEIDLSAWDELPDSHYVGAMTNSDWFQSTGLMIPDDASDEDIAVAMRASKTLHSSDSWVRGDLVEWLRTHRFGGNDIPRHVLQTMADELGLGSVKTLLNCATTARAWPIDYRHASHELSFSHHAALNALPLEEKQAWAERAIADGMSVTALREAVQNDAMSITVDNTGDPEAGQLPLGRTVTFSSEVVNKKVIIEETAESIWSMLDTYSGGVLDARTKEQLLTAVKISLSRLEGRGLIKFPPSKWSGQEGLNWLGQAAYDRMMGRPAQDGHDEDEQESA